MYSLFTINLCFENCRKSAVLDTLGTTVERSVCILIMAWSVKVNAIVVNINVMPLLVAQL